MKTRVLLGLFLALYTAPVLCEDSILRINTTTDFKNFVKAVNSGKGLAQETVLLESAIDFSECQEELEPIGIDENNAFTGTFDGQGFSIGGINLNSTKGYIGLFGFTRGATIKNTIFSMSNTIYIDESSIGSPREILYAGSIVGYCEKGDNSCNIENCVNLANVTYAGTIERDVRLGGIAGRIYSRQDSHIRNCANYGMVTGQGIAKSIAIGGIIGVYDGITATLTASNCLNLGTVTFNAYTTSWSVGGLVGHSNLCSFDNCVSAGKIKTSETRSSTVGVLCGKSTSTTFKNCYWHGAAGDLAQGTDIVESSSFNSSFILNKTVTAGNYTGDNLIDALNSAVYYYSLYEYSHWGYSEGKHNINCTINERETKSFYPDSQLLLFPGLSSDGSLSFNGWYVDKECTTLLTDFVFKSDAEIFGKWTENKNNYAVSFEMHGGLPEIPPIKGLFNTRVKLTSEGSKGECGLAWWENDYGDEVGWDFTIPARDTTLHAVWSCKEITSARDLTSLAKILLHDTSFKSDIVTLENDIEFTDEESEKFKPIGTKEFNFDGIFDGQGYMIKNLKLKTSTSSYGGIFGYSKGTTIRNVVIDFTCSVTSTYGSGASNDQESYFSTLIGYCETINGPCTLENNVNMANVTFNGISNTNVFLGGLAGYIKFNQNYRSNVINCVNYGAVAHVGITNNFADVGGLLAGCDGGARGVYILNSINYGTIHNEGSSKTPCIGGIVGYSEESAHFENCLSLGKIFMGQSKQNDYIGAITGEAYGGSTIKYCYWDNSFEHNATGTKSNAVPIENSFSFNPAAFVLTERVSVGNYTGHSLVGALNGYAEMNVDSNYSNWAINANRYTVTFKITNRTSPFLALDSQIILIPNISDIQGETFFGWFVDPKYSKFFNSSVISKNITLYGFMNETYVPPEESEEYDSLKEALPAIIGVACTVLFIAIILVVVGFVFWGRFKSKMKAKKEVQQLMEPMLFDRPANSIDFLGLYTDDYEKPTLKNALIRAGVEVSRAEMISSMCYRHAEKLYQEKKLPKGVSMDDAAAIAMYTMEDESLDKKPYRMINDALMKGEFEELIHVRDLLYLVMRALRKMPIVYNKPLYRGIRSDVINEINPSGIDKKLLDTATGKEPEEGPLRKINEPINDKTQRKRDIFLRGGESFDEDYLEGETVFWPALSSTSSNVAVTKAFLAKGTDSKKAEGTLFMIENGWGYNIQPCSMFPGEEEIVLEPERRFRVKTVIPGEGLTVIKMEMLRTPLVLTEVFGETKGKTSKAVSRINVPTQSDRKGERFLSPRNIFKSNFSEDEY